MCGGRVTVKGGVRPRVSNSDTSEIIRCGAAALYEELSAGRHSEAARAGHRKWPRVGVESWL